MTLSMAGKTRTERKHKVQKSGQRDESLKRALSGYRGAAAGYPEVCPARSRGVSMGGYRCGLQKARNMARDGNTFSY